LLATLRKAIRSPRWTAVIALGVLLSLCAGAPFALAQNAPAEAQTCTRQPGQGGGGPGLKQSIKLVPDLPSQTVNFGGTRGWEFVDMVLTATPALPLSVTPNQIRLSILRHFTRTSQTLPTATAPSPVFTQPQISAGRDRVTFTVCLNGAGLPAGSFTGSVIVEGPAGVVPTTLAITENAKDDTLASWLAGVLLFAAFVFLLLRGAATRQAADEQHVITEAARATAEASNAAVEATQGTAAAGDVQQAAGEVADHVAQFQNVQANPQQHSVLWYFGQVLKDLNWWLTTLVALGVAAGSIIAIYSANASWGADVWTSVASLVGAVFTAVGVQSVVTSLGRTVGR
jgi:hypothetical protein